MHDTVGEAADDALTSDELLRYAEVLVAAGAPGAAVVVRARDTLVSAASGLADLRGHEPMHAGLRFRAGSITKAFVATLVLQLVDEGWLSLSDSVERWVPGALPYADDVQLWHLLSHTSGIPDYVPLVAAQLVEDPRIDYTPHELLARVYDAPPQFSPGSAWAYSNTGYVLLGLVVEAVTGEPLHDELAQRIVQPLGLTRTSLPVDEIEIPPPRAHGYAPALDEHGAIVPGPLVDVTEQNPSWAWASGALVSTLDELTRFVRALLRGELVSPPLVATMQATVEVPPASLPVPLFDAYGLGLVAVDLPRGRLYGQFGGIRGYLSAVLGTAVGQRQLGVMVNLGERAQKPVYDALVATTRALGTRLLGRSLA